ncbi:cyclic nucleotide-binding domain-containing protein [Azotosporobacter soli]|uniref:cyclic nucleotide-binding domain-containing protein n=1 Tax=Azotosporobacter soli TaxID=3055040 RepID=UPI0031FE57AA
MNTSHDQRNKWIERYRLADILPSSVLAALTLRRFSHGEFLLREGQPTTALYFLVAGSCKAVKDLGNGKESLLCFNRSFTLLGELELIAGIASDAKHSVEAVSEVLCIVLPTAATRESLLAHTPFLRFMTALLCHKLIRNNQNQSINLHYTVEQRLASYILCSQDQHCFRENHTRLAGYLGCSHRQLLRAIRHFCEQGWLAKDDVGYRICNPSALSASAGNDLYETQPFPYP